MKITLAKSHALNGQLMAAGTYEVADESAQKLIAKGHAVAAAEGAKLGPVTPPPAEPAAPKPTRKSREEKAAE